MSDEFGNWSDLARLWHAHCATAPSADIEKLARRQRLQMQALAAAEAAGLALALFGAAVIARQTALIAMPAICMMFFAFCGYLQHRMRREPRPSGGDDLITSLDASIALEEWTLAQLGIGRAVTFITLAAIGMVASDHLRFHATTPPARLWSLLAITAAIAVVLCWNLWLTRRARLRKRGMEQYSSLLRTIPDSSSRKKPHVDR
jgi:hypothetical protein